MGPEAVAEGLPHVHDAVGNEFGPVFAEPLPELLEVFLLAAFDDVQELGSARPFQGADHRPVGLAFAHGDLVSSQDRDAVQGSLGLDLLKSLLVEGLDRGPMQQHQGSRGFDGHDLAQLVDQGSQRSSNHGAVRRERQRFQAQTARRTFDLEALDAQESRIFPEAQVLDLDPPAGIGLFDSMATFYASVTATQPFELQDDATSTSARLHLQVGDTISLNSKEFPEIMKAHRVWSSRLSIASEQREYSLPDASFWRLSRSETPGASRRHSVQAPLHTIANTFLYGPRARYFVGLRPPKLQNGPTSLHNFLS